MQVKKLGKELINKELLKRLSVMVAVGSICLAFDVVDLKAAELMDINLGYSVIRKAGDNDGSKIYYGSNGIPTIWRCMPDFTPSKGNALTLFADETIGDMQYDSVHSKNWSGSELCKYLNSVEEFGSSGFLTSQFTEEERKHMLSEYSNKDEGYSSQECKPNQTIVIPSIDEIYAWFTKPTAEQDEKDSGLWWLRSPYGTHAYVGSASGVDESRPCEVMESLEIRPAFKLNLDSIFFVCAGNTSKGDFQMVGASNSLDSLWKLTLKNGDTGFEAILPTTGTAGQEVTIGVSAIGNNTYNGISALLTKEDGSVVAYGEIGGSEVGDKTFTIPTDVVDGTYILHVFAEQQNGEYGTDYVSNEVAGGITIGPKVVDDTANSADTNTDTNTDTETTKKKDNVPKTGEKDSLGWLGLLTMIFGVGVVYLTGQNKKLEHKERQ